MYGARMAAADQWMTSKRRPLASEQGETLYAYVSRVRSAASGCRGAAQPLPAADVERLAARQRAGGRPEAWS